MKKRILISAGGTAISWHLASLASRELGAYFDVFVCDVNPSHLVPASRLANAFFQVPFIEEPTYRSHMLQLFSDQRIDIFVPLIDSDVHTFPSDLPEMATLGTLSTGVCSKTSQLIRDKRRTVAYLESHGFRVAATVSPERAARNPEQAFFAKPAHGFGSREARALKGAEVLQAIQTNPDMLIQELCQPPEITVEVFNREIVLSLCRERLETKAGVCTKARLYADAQLQLLAERLCGALDLPVAFCFQVMKGPNDEWLITDLNPRLGAGTAMSTAYGWSLASAALVCYGDLPLDPRQFLRTRAGDKYVTRVYQEIVMD